jgi:hypothetical protein
VRILVTCYDSHGKLLIQRVNGILTTDRRTLAAATKDEQLMSDQHRFCNDGTESAGPCQPRQGDDQMNE